MVLTAVVDHTFPLYVPYAPLWAGKALITAPMAVAEAWIVCLGYSPAHRAEFLRRLLAVPQLALTEDVLRFWAVLRRVPQHLSQNDTWMAAFALAYGYPLLTDDGDFARLRGRTFEGRALIVLSNNPKLAGMAQQPHDLAAGGAS